MTELQIWVIIAVCVLAGGSALTVALSRGGVSVGYKDWTVYIPESTRRADPTLAARLQCLEERLPIIARKKRQLYLKLLKEHGVPDEYLTANEDFHYYQLCLNIFLYSMNGLRSVQAVMQRDIAEQRYSQKRRDDEWGAYVDDIMDRLTTVIDSNLNRDYDSQSTEADGRIRNRTISREELYEADHDPEHLHEIQRIVEDILIGARQLGCRGWNADK